MTKGLCTVLYFKIPTSVRKITYNFQIANQNRNCYNSYLSQYLSSMYAMQQNNSDILFLSVCFVLCVMHLCVISDGLI